MGKTKKSAAASSKARKERQEYKAREARQEAEAARAVELVKSAPEEVSSEPLQRIGRLNKRLAIVYGIQALLALVLIQGSVAVTAVYLGDNSAANQPGQPAYVPVIRELFQAPVGQLVAIALAISAAFHYIQMSYIRRDYELRLKHNQSPYRWLDNAFSFSLLPVVIGLVAGMRDISSLLMIFVLGFVAHILGWQFDRQLAAGHAPDARRTFLVLATAGLAAWLALAAYLVFGAVFGVGVTLSVALAFGLTFLLTLLQGWILYQRLHQLGRWHDFLYAERTFIIVGVIAKSLLAWQILAATL